MRYDSALTMCSSSGQTTKLEEFDTFFNALLAGGVRHNVFFELDKFGDF